MYSLCITINDKKSLSAEKILVENASAARISRCENHIKKLFSIKGEIDFNVSIECVCYENKLQLSMRRWNSLQLKSLTVTQVASGPRVSDNFTAQLKTFPPQISQLILVFDNIMHTFVIW